MKNLLLFLLLIQLSTANQKPKLVVFLVVDQSQPEILKKYNSLFEGGLRWLIDNGIEYSEAYHEHSYTATAPGHFAISTGRYPGKGGVIGNWWFDRASQSGWYCVEDSESSLLTTGSTGRSYRYVGTSGLGDWLKAESPKSQVISISGKDRSAIYLGGRNSDLTLWYDKQGSWTTSTFYADKLPDWVVDFNRNLNVAGYRDSVWNRLLPANIYNKFTRPDFYPGEVDNSKQDVYSPVLPLFFNRYTAQEMESKFYYTWWGDRAVLDLGQKAILTNDLGADLNTDIIFLSLSATDGVGHDYGPNSQEQLDNLLRLDLNLGNFINFLDGQVGLENIFFVLSSDHGSMALPEYLKNLGYNSGRISKPDRDSLYNQIKGEINLHLGEHKVTRSGNSFYFVDALNKKQKQTALNIVKKHILKLQGVKEVLTKSEILNNTEKDQYHLRLKNMIHLDKSPDIIIIQEKYWTWRWPAGSTHGSPYDYDAQVPLIFSRTGWNHKIISDKVATVDIAPTVARFINIQVPLENVDGKILDLK